MALNASEPGVAPWPTPESVVLIKRRWREGAAVRESWGEFGGERRERLINIYRADTAGLSLLQVHSLTPELPGRDAKLVHSCVILRVIVSLRISRVQISGAGFGGLVLSTCNKSGTQPACLLFSFHRD